MTVESPVKSLDELLAGSAATEAFRQAVRALDARTDQDLIRSPDPDPPVKMQRLAMKLIEEYPDIAFETLDIYASSGCGNYTGKAVAEPGSIHFSFDWDCYWKAQQEGWKDAFGDPDQGRAARTFGYQCFRSFERLES